MTGALAGFTPGATFQMTHVVPYAFRDLEGVGRLDDRTEARSFTYFSTWVSHGLFELMDVEVGYYLRRKILAGDGRFGNPLWDRYQDMRIYLSVGLDVASVAKALL